MSEKEEKTIMTEEFKNEIQSAIQSAKEITFTKLYEENKKYVRDYEKLVLEAIRLFDFSKYNFNDEALKTRTDLVGKTDRVSTYFVEYGDNGRTYTADESDDAIIHLSYVVDSRNPKSRECVIPDYLSNHTYEKSYMPELLAEQGIHVKYNSPVEGRSDTADYYISFDSSELVEAIHSVKEDIKTRNRAR